MFIGFIKPIYKSSYICLMLVELFIWHLIVLYYKLFALFDAK